MSSSQDSETSTSSTAQKPVRNMTSMEPDEPPRFPLAAFQPTLGSFINNIMPKHLAKLQAHQSAMVHHINQRQWDALSMEEISANNVLMQLKGTLKELSRIRSSLVDSDIVKFESMVGDIHNRVLVALASFAELTHTMNETVLERSPYHSFISPSQDDGVEGFVVIRDSDVQLIQEQQSMQKTNTQTSEDTACLWARLTKSLADLHQLSVALALIVKNQGHDVEHIAENISLAEQTTRRSLINLIKAQKYCTYAVPAVGALLGTVVGGPVGMVAGFKLSTLAAGAALGGIAGYAGGRLVKTRVLHQAAIAEEKAKSTADDFYNGT